MTAANKETERRKPPQGGSGTAPSTGPQGDKRYYTDEDREQVANLERRVEALETLVQSLQKQIMELSGRLTSTGTERVGGDG